MTSAVKCSRNRVPGPSSRRSLRPWGETEPVNATVDHADIRGLGRGGLAYPLDPADSRKLATRFSPEIFSGLVELPGIKGARLCGIPTIFTRTGSDFGSVDRGTGGPRAGPPIVTSAADRQ
jgi:hypothetical protein